MGVKGRMYNKCIGHFKVSLHSDIYCVYSQKVVEVGNGEKLCIECKTCKKEIIYYGDRKVVVCGHCRKGTVSMYMYM